MKTMHAKKYRNITQRLKRAAYERRELERVEADKEYLTYRVEGLEEQVARLLQQLKGNAT